MQHMVNKAHICWMAANLISGHLALPGNHRNGTAGHSQGWCSAQKSSDLGKKDGLRPGSGCHGGLPVLSCDAMRGNCDNCATTPMQTYLHKSAHRPWGVRRPRGLENS